MIINPIHATSSALAAFLASLVEFVEALTVILAVGTVRGWRSALAGTIAALAVLAALIALFGSALAHVPLVIVQLFVGGLLLLFGLRWLRKAVLRAAGVIHLHDEAAIFTKEATAMKQAKRDVAVWDKLALATTFQITMLEGIEVVFIVVAMGAELGLLKPAIQGALAALLLVVLLGITIKGPLTKVPENTLKFVVSIILTSFGAFWIGEGAGVVWPGGDLSILGLIATCAILSLAVTGICRSRYRKILYLNKSFSTLRMRQKMSALEGIKHVIVLMLENRSFDCMLGQLYPDNPNFEGLGKNPGANYSNPYQRPDGVAENYPAWNDDSLGPASVCIPDPDPGELFADMNVQLFGKDGTPNNHNPPPMNGFVENYMQQVSSNDPMAVVHYFTPKQVPVISQLAKAFGVCDQWHASAPCQTWPNRFFVHSGTCNGNVNNADFSLPYTRETIFKRLRDNNRTFRIYYHDVPQTITLSDILEPPFHFHPFSEFLENAREGALPDYSFIEPRYFTDAVLGLLPNDEHPPHNIVYGEELIAEIYNAVRSAPTWKQTLLVITYDEHGGCYDHMPPPSAVPPDGVLPNGSFSFDRYGVRVPAVIISPYMPPGSIIRSAPNGLQHEGPPYPFDHTSIIATLRNLFDLGPPLTGRDAVAPDLLGPLSLQDPTNDGPPQVIPISALPSATEVAKAASLPPNHMQEHLCRAVAALPKDTVAAMLPTITKQIPTGQ